MTNYLYNTGSTSYSSPMAVEYGFVEQTNGHLHLQIPIGEKRTQRGGSARGTQVYLVYDSNFWTPNSPGATTLWYPSANTDYSGWSITPSQPYIEFNANPYVYILYDEYGVEHDFPCSSGCYSTDGAGYWFEWSDGKDGVYAPDGTAYNVKGGGDIGSIRDSNGNYFTSDVVGTSNASYPGYLEEMSYVDSSGIEYLDTLESGGTSTGAGATYERIIAAEKSMNSSNSGDRLYQMSIVQIQMNTNFGQNGISECTGTECLGNVISNITLPDGTAFTFQYDCDSTISAQSAYCSSPGGQTAYYGAMTRITTPTGAVYSYTYIPFVDAYGNSTLSVSSRSNGSTTWTYQQSVLSTCASRGVGCQQSFKTTEHNGRIETLTTTLNNGAWPVDMLITDSSGNKLSETVTQWDFSHNTPISVLTGAAYIHKQSESNTIWGADGAMTKLTTYMYDSYLTGNLTAVKSWGYHSGASPSFPSVPDTAVYTAYYTPPNSPVGQLGGTNIINKPSSTTICGSTGTDGSCPGGGSRVSQTLISYDIYGSGGPSSVTGTAHHDDAEYGATLTVRGNPTSIAQWVYGSTYDTRFMTYDTTGQITSLQDGNGNMSIYTYNDNYYIDNNSSSPSTFSSNILTHAYLTSITAPQVNGKVFNSTIGYYYGNSKIAFVTDPNSQTTYHHYYGDPLDRSTSTVYPDGSWSAIAYTSPTQIDIYQSLASASMSTSCSGCLHSQLIMDNEGRTIRTVRPDGSKIDTTYDELGRVQAVTNPYQSTVDSTYGMTSYAYDIQNRVTMLCNPNNSSTPSSICTPGNSYRSNTYYVNSVLSTDENGNTRRYFSDSLGRLSDVFEPNGASSSPSMDTNYAYDALGNLLSVSQYGGISGTPSKVRRFTYDGHSRLVTASNPESGYVCYGTLSGSTCVNGYDGNGNLLYKTDARGVVTSYAYDALNRILGESYSDGVTPVSCFQYDGAVSMNGATRLLNAWTLPASSTCSVIAPSTGYITMHAVTGYDAMGRLKDEQQNPYAPLMRSYSFSYRYDPAGNLILENNGLASSSLAPLSYGYSYDAAGRLQSVVATQPTSWTYPTTLFSSTPQSNSLNLNGNSGVSYDAFGNLINGSYGIAAGSSTPNIFINRAFDSSGHIAAEADGSTASTTTNTNSVGQIVISGLENGPVTVPGTTASTTLTVSGTEGSHQLCKGFGAGRTCETIPDLGMIDVTINSPTACSVEVLSGEGDTDDSVATSLATAIQSNCANVVSAILNSSIHTVTLTTIATGSTANYAISISNYADFTATSSGAAFTGGTDATSLYDAGIVTSTIYTPSGDYTTSPVSWGQGSTPHAISVALASAIQVATETTVGDSSTRFVTAQVVSPSTCSACVITLTSTSSGIGSDYGVIANVVDSRTSIYPSQFPSPSFTATIQNMTGGAIASQVYVYSVPKSGYAPNGNLLAYEDSVMGSWKFYYDTLNRLTGGTSISGPYAGYTNCLAYDPYGNRIEYLFQANNTNCPTAPLSSTQQTATYSANNQLTSIAETMPIVNNAGTGLNEVTASGNPTYDASGNVTNDGVNSYAYDGEGRLCAVKNDVVGGTPHEYLYDATGMRVAVGTLNAWPPYCITPPSNAAGNSFTVMINGISYTFTLVKQYLLDKNGNQATELDGSGNWVHSNVWIGGHTLATYDARGLHFHLTDPLGSRRVQMSSAGVVEEYCWSLPFGESLSCVQTGLSSANDATEHHFTGKERDTESGLDYFGARYYASTMGRFLSPDPSGLEYADPTTPQSLNLYAYVRNNPLNNIDPSGMECVWDDGSYDAADDPDTGEGNNGSGKSAADKCGRQGGTWEDPTWFEDMEGTQYGDWSGEASSQVQFDMLTPSINANTPNNAPTLDQINSMIIAGSLNDFFKWLSCNGKQNCYQGAQYPLSAPEAWLPKNNYCGRNGAGNPVSRNDWACAVHDYNYRQIGGSGKGYSFWSNPSPKVAMQLRQADRILFENTSGFEGAVIGGVELTAVPFTAFYSLTH